MAKKPQPKKVASKPVVANVPKSDQQRWQAEDDIRTIQRHEELMKDKARLARAAALAKKNAQDALQTAKKAGTMAGKK